MPAHLQKVGSFLVAFAAWLVSAQADPIEDFYKGQTISIVVGYPVGGGYDLLSRVVAHHLGNHLPGKPRAIVQNMPGAGSRTAASFIYGPAPQNGTVIGIVSQYLPLAHLLSSDPSMDMTKFHWLGSLGQGGNNVMIALKSTGITSVEDLKRIPLVVASAGPQTNTEYYVAALNNMFGTKIKSIAGYQGTADVQLAIEKGELQGMASVDWPGLKRSHASWLFEDKINVVLQFGMKREEELSSIPLLRDLARNEEERRVLDIISNGVDIGRPYFVGPGVPPDRVTALTKAFDAMREDPAFKEEVAKSGLVLNPIPATELRRLVVDSSVVAPELKEKLRNALNTKGLGR